MKSMKNEVIRAFLEVKEAFPFPNYMDNNLTKYASVLSEIMNEFPVGSKILSIGAGPCDFEAILSKLGYVVTAVDDLKDHWHLIGNNRTRIRDFAEKMSVNLLIKAEPSVLKENYFDVVLLIDIIEHLHQSPRELLNYSISLLKPNGMLVIETPNTVALAKRLKVLFGKSNHVDADFFYWNIGDYRSHVREYTLFELKQILAYHNIHEVKSKMVNIMVDMVKDANFFVLTAYKLLSGVYPNFRDTILISGKKPKDWLPTSVSINDFKRCYSHLKTYNLDNESNDDLIKKMLSDA
jgi:2-polyprenyl-3-methyl-5-hydroxy-6-metoxy-1,4-benzoquinol methylase